MAFQCAVFFCFLDVEDHPSKIDVHTRSALKAHKAQLSELDQDSVMAVTAELKVTIDGSSCNPQLLILPPFLPFLSQLLKSKRISSKTKNTIL